MEAKGLDLWYTEEHSKEAKFSIKVLRQLYSVQSPFQKIDNQKNSAVFLLWTAI